MDGEFGPVAYVRTTQTNAAAIRLHLRHRAALGKRAARPLWSGEWLKRAAAASKCLGKRPWWLISTMLFVTVSSKPICQKLS